MNTLDRRAIDYAREEGYTIASLAEVRAAREPMIWPRLDRADNVKEWEALRQRIETTVSERGLPDSVWVWFDHDDDCEGFMLVGPSPAWLLVASMIYLDHLNLVNKSSFRAKVLRRPDIMAKAAMMGLMDLRDTYL